MFWLIKVLLSSSLSFGFILKCTELFSVTRSECFAKIRFCSLKGIPLEWSPNCAASEDSQNVLGDCVCGGQCNFKCEQLCARDPNCAWDSLTGCNTLGNVVRSLSAKLVESQECPVVRTTPGGGDVFVPEKCDPNPNNDQSIMSSYCPNRQNPSCAPPSSKNPFGCVCVGDGLCIKELDFNEDEYTSVNHICCGVDDDTCLGRTEFPKDPLGPTTCNSGRICVSSCYSELGLPTCRELCDFT